MDTHADHLHKISGHGWRHYFFEFFMLFLAVFCGFLAENLREGIINRETEKRNMETMVANLKSDTASLHEVIGLNLFRPGGSGTPYMLVFPNYDVRMASPWSSPSTR